MSVYTVPEMVDIQLLLAQLGLPDAVALTPITGGIENSNFFLVLADGSEWVLTLFEELTAKEAVFLGPLLSRLAKAGLPVAAPRTDSGGQWLHTLAGKPAQVAPRLKGAHPVHPDLVQCQAMGESLAQLHLALKDYPLQRHHAHGPDWWAEMAVEWRPRLSPDDQSLLDTIVKRYQAILADDLPAGLIHGDLFRDNMLFVGHKVSGVLDFSECGEDHWLLDIAITSNDFCRTWPDNQPDDKRRQAFLAGYETRRPLTALEKESLPVFLGIAALRFWLSRLDVQARNEAENRKGEHVLQKDPAEMRDLLKSVLAL